LDEDVAMDPLQVLREYSKENPKSAALLFGAVACFAAVAAIGAFSSDLESSVPSVLWVLLIGALLLIVTYIVNNKLMMGVLSWFAVAMLIGWIIVSVLHRFFPRSGELACAAIWWAPCLVTADSRATPSQIPPVSPPAIPTTASFKPQDYTVVVQFAGTLAREDVRVMMQKLEDNGWRVQGTKEGGERTAAAAGKNEVRFAEGDKGPAEALAKSVQGTNLIRNVTVTPGDRSVQKGRLELWISR
jgi:hypothetical protein